MTSGIGSAVTTNATRAAGDHRGASQLDPMKSRKAGQKTPLADVVAIGLGWTCSIMAHELTDESLSVMAIKRVPAATPGLTSPGRPSTAYPSNRGHAAPAVSGGRVTSARTHWLGQESEVNGVVIRAAPL